MQPKQNSKIAGSQRCHGSTRSPAVARRTDRFWDMVTIRLKPFIKNCGQTAADGNMVTIDCLQKVVIALSYGTIANPLRSSKVSNFQVV